MSQESAQRVCPAEQSGWLTSSFRRLLQSPERILRDLAREGQTAVDLGCGPGFFTLPLAQMVGPNGHVVAVDIQEAMLKKLQVRAEANGLAARIECHRSQPEDIGLEKSADLVLAFYMLHEVPSKEVFLRQVRGLIKTGGLFLLVEPRGHVSGSEFRSEIDLVEQTGFSVVERRRVALSRACLFQA